MLTPGGLGQVCQALCGGCQPAQGLFLSWKVGLASSFKQHPSQGLLIPSPAADHVNPALSDRALCPATANPPACRGGDDGRPPELTSAARKSLCTKVRTAGQRRGEEAEYPSAHLYECFKDHTCDIGKRRSRDGRLASRVSLGLPGALVPLFTKGQ